MRWRWRILIALVLVGVPAWLVAGNRLFASELRDSLFAATGIRPEIGFVVFGPDLNLHVFAIRFRDERVRVRVPYAKFVIPVSRLWGTGRATSIRIRQLDAWVQTDADLSTIRSEESEAAANDQSRGLHPEIRCEELAIYLEDEDGDVVPFLISDWLVAKAQVAEAKDKSETFIELGAGRFGEVFIEGASARVVPVYQHLMIEDFEMRAFRGTVTGFLDLHLQFAGRYNGEVTCKDLDVETICRRLGIEDAFRRKGRISGRVTVDAWGLRLSQIKGVGDFRMHDASFWSPVSFRVVGVLDLPQRRSSTVRAAEFSFSMERGLLYLESGAIHSEDYELGLCGIFDLEGACDLEASYGGTTVAIRGNVQDPTVKILPFDAITVPFDRLYRDKLRER